MNRKAFIPFLLLIFSFSCIVAQNFEGRIIDENQQPITGSLVLIKETYQGVACNDKGEFQLNLSPGVYTVDFRCLGYTTITEKISIENDDKVTRNIVLKENPVLLEEVLILGDEDPAYEIMKKTIDKAPYHQSIIKKYRAECYVKGNMELTKVGFLVNNMINIDGAKPSEFKKHLFIQESFSEIEYKAPDQYDQNVIAFNSTIPDNFNPKQVIPLATSSLYLPRFSIHISPLNPDAFTYYRFQYEGYSEEKDDVINKIKVIPKVNDPELLEGYLYIADTSWNIRYADLKSNVLGIEQHINITYDNLGGIAYMPTTFSNKISGKVLDAEGYFNYYASIKYLDFEKNDSIDYDEIKQKIIITHKDLKKNLEINWEDFYRVKSDSLAMKRDSVFWENIRNTPLSSREIYSYQTKDSLQKHFDSVKKNPKKSNFKPIDLLMGGSLGGDSTLFTFTHGGIPGILREYNFVDGFGWGYKFSLSTPIKQKNRLTIIPEIYYASARKSMVWKTNVKYDYSPLRLGQLEVSAGNTSTDFNPSGVNRQDNAMSSFLWGRNAIMFYRNQFFKITNNIDLSHALRFSTQLKWADRSPLQNNKDYSFFKGTRKVVPNRIDDKHTDLLSYALSIQYTPRYYYSIVGGKKRYVYASSPTFSLRYSEAFSSLKENNARFRMLEGTIYHELKTDLFSTIAYQINIGAFLGANNKMNLADYKHFDATGDIMLIAKTPFKSLMLLDPYIASTNKYWAYSHFNYRSKYILLTRIPFLQGKFLNETLHFKYLFTPQKKNYMELGYSIDLIKSFAAGLHWSFNNFKFESFDARFSIKMDFFNSFR